MFKMNKAVSVKWSAGVAAVLMTLTIGVCGTAHSGEGQPIFEFVSETAVVGQPINCTVGLTSGGTNVTIYSDPPGAVSYQGYVATSTVTVAANTDTAGLAPGTPITIYAETDGSTTVAAQTITAESTGGVLAGH